MKFNKWTVGLAAVGLVSLTSARADESKMSQVNTALSNTTLSGYVDVSAQFNPNGGGDNPNYSFGNKGNGFNFNVADIALDKPQDETPWASGYHVELWIGPDGAALGTTGFKSTGTNTTTTATSTSSQATIRQAYIALRTPIGNGIDWKLGVWDTIIGYESTTSGNNPNYSHSYGYNMEPTTHTGLLGTYKINDMFTVQAGVADTSYAGFGGYTAGLNTGLYLPTWLGAVAFTAPDNFGWAKGATLTGGIINSSGSTASEGGGGPSGGATSFYAGFTLPTPVAALKLGGSFDYENARDINANQWALAGYGTFAFSEKLSLNLRAEYLDVLGAAANQEEVTATVQYALWANVLTRVEVRWDHSEPGGGFASNRGDNFNSNAFMLAAQAIYTF
jgi:hypothetical protein